ncbi:MAG: peptide chain release factor N(5)-glutamine methyltransferase [Firmicutes bacterium]|nr:peptide chain release factor N(5)-glutamine methyltransferase [Bacillota bacterium]
MPKTYNDLYLETRKLLREHGIESYNLEARIIVSQAAGKSMEKFLQGLRLYTGDDTQHKVNELLARRLKGEPVAYLTGRWEFYGIPIDVSPDVLIPRPETELLVDKAIAMLNHNKMDARILDLCAGSGCVGCAIAYRLHASRVVMIDNSRSALAVCRRNVALNTLGARATCIEADIFDSPPMLVGSFDLVAMNPPYIPSADIIGLPTSVRDFEPRSALDGGEDGLNYYRAFLKNWKGILREGGAVIFEVGAGQAGAVMQMLQRASFSRVESFKDLNGIERIVAGRA